MKYSYICTWMKRIPCFHWKMNVEMETQRVYTHHLGGTSERLESATEVHPSQLITSLHSAQPTPTNRACSMSLFGYWCSLSLKVFWLLLFLIQASYHRVYSYYWSTGGFIICTGCGREGIDMVTILVLTTTTHVLGM